MANKIFYVKKVDTNTELCMGIGWEDKNKYSIFYRSIDNKSTTVHLGLFESKEAWAIFNAAEEYSD